MTRFKIIQDDLEIADLAKIIFFIFSAVFQSTIILLTIVNFFCIILQNYWERTYASYASFREELNFQNGTQT